MSNLTSRLGLFAGLLIATTITAFGCHSTLPSIFIVMEDPTGLGPDQLRVTVRVDEADSVTVVRPEKPGAPMTGTQTMRLLMPEAAVNQTAWLSIDALREGASVGHATTVARVAADVETVVTVALVPGKVGCVGIECGCDATTCPSGCCDGDTCVQGAVESCGTAGGACEACPAEATDRCVEGACRCGPDAPCPQGYACEGGSCMPTGAGPACTTKADCSTPPSQCHEAEGECGSEGTCIYSLRAAGTGCNDGNSCTDGDACTAEGVCAGTVRVCTGGGGCFATAGQCVNGSCLFEPRPSGTACNDGNACTSGETCNGAGSCMGGSPKVCNTPPSQCHESTGTCGADGNCVYAVRTNQSCNDGNACTTVDTCNSAGTCVGGSPKVCNAPPTQCHVATGTCGADGNCTYAIQSGKSCDDGNACTINDSCNSAGTCVGGSPKVCNAPPTQCHANTGTCGAGGNCSYDLQPGKSCNDGNECTGNDTCNASGACVGNAVMHNGNDCGNCRRCSNGVCGGGCGSGERCCAPDPFCVGQFDQCP